MTISKRIHTNTKKFCDAFSPFLCNPSRV